LAAQQIAAPAGRFSLITSFYGNGGTKFPDEIPAERQSRRSSGDESPLQHCLEDRFSSWIDLWQYGWFKFIAYVFSWCALWSHLKDIVKEAVREVLKERDEAGYRTNSTVITCSYLSLLRSSCATAS
jgi:hypothetical protein